ncbi:MAG: UDP-N-acetylmuramoyl-L-alanyl-D-glutamate--2,6-diaminopimelate ligase [Pseudomonadota bacterium]
MSTRLNTPLDAAKWLRARVTGSLWTDSRKVGAGDGFIAWPGAATDARQYVAEVLAAGAEACIVEDEGSASFNFANEKIAAYAGLKSAAGPIAAAYFEEPSKQLQLVAVTGTNGKTSTAWWLAQALDKTGNRCGIIGTLGVGEPGAMVFNGLTTPDPVLLHQQLRRFVDEGFAACALEASSIGIAEHRLDATWIKVAIFTNFTQDHLDYHGSMDAYWQAKKKLFSWTGLEAVVLNLDDDGGHELDGLLSGAGLDVWTVSIGGLARIRAEQIEHGSRGLSFDLVEGADRQRVSTAMVGLYNVSNLLGVVAALRALGVSLKDAAHACQDLAPVPGRLETLAVEGMPLVAIDYAHTPDALEKVLTALQPLAHNRKGRLWCLFGCGGDRDAAKRPLMAAVAQKNADQIVVTSDNPRSENPAAIISQILLGLTHSDAVYVEADRVAAIRQAINEAKAEDVILIAGKGHENYQEIKGVKHPFSDRTHAETALAARQPAIGSAS